MAVGPETLRDCSREYCQLPSLGQQQETTITQAPVSDGGFFYSQFGEGIDAATRRLPIDPLTRLPLTVLPVEGIPTANKDADRNYHHNWCYRQDPHLEGKTPIRKWQYMYPERLGLDVISGLAVRVSRGQVLPIGAHVRAHHRFQLGPVLPRKRDDKFAAVVFALANVVPRWTIDMSRPVGKELLHMDDYMYRFVADSSRLGIEKSSNVRPMGSQKLLLGYFMLRYAAQQSSAASRESIADEFLATSDGERKKQCGTVLLTNNLAVALDNLRPTYEDARRRGMVATEDTRDLLTKVGDYILPSHVPLVFDALTAKLQKEYRVAA